MRSELPGARIQDSGFRIQVPVSWLTPIIMRSAKCEAYHPIFAFGKKGRGTIAYGNGGG